MLRFLKYLVLVVLALAMLTVALANRTPVVLNALLPDMGLFTGLHVVGGSCRCSW